MKKFVRESVRVYISRLDGSLYLSHLKKADEKAYSCNIVSSELQTGHYGPFFNLKVADAEGFALSDIFEIVRFKTELSIKVFQRKNHDSLTVPIVFDFFHVLFTIRCQRG